MFTPQRYYDYGSIQWRLSTVRLTLQNVAPTAILFCLLGNYKECPNYFCPNIVSFGIFIVAKILTAKVRQKDRNVRITASSKIRGLSSLPSVYPVKVIYPHAANMTLITTASETDTCVTRDQFFNVGSCRDPYIKKLLWLQMNAETHTIVNVNVGIHAYKIHLRSIYSKVGETQHSHY